MNRKRRESGIDVQCAHLEGSTRMWSIKVRLTHVPYLPCASVGLTVPLQRNHEHIQIVSLYYEVFGLLS